MENQIKENSVAKKRLLGFVEYVEMFVFAVLAVLAVYTFAFKICVVDGTSMNKTLEHGEKLLTHNIFYSPEYGDIVVFYENQSLKKPLVKRVIATENQTLIINHKDGTVTVDGKLLDEDYVYLLDGYYKNYESYLHDENSDTLTVTIPEGYVFVMGDNRNNSTDSRYESVGLVSEQHIIGKVVCRLSPFTTFD